MPIAPGLDGFLAQRQFSNQDQNAQLGQLQGILGIQNAMTQQAQQQKDMQLRGILGQKLQSGDQEGAKQILMQMKPELFAQSFIPPKPEWKDAGGELVLVQGDKVITRLPKSATQDTVLREQGANTRHEKPSGSAVLGANTTMRGQDISAQTAREGHSITLRGQNLTDARSRESLAAGKVPPGYRMNMDGTMSAITGGPADLKAQADAQKRASGSDDVGVALSTLRDAYNRLEEGGGITSVKNSGIANVPAALASSAAGQATGKLFGTQNQSARNDIAMARPALLAALMRATGMSAKQMDSNAELKLWLATATDPTLDVEANRRALDNIEKKYINPVKSAAPKVPNVGDVVDGHRFKGGNPADKANWEKI